MRRRRAQLVGPGEKESGGQPDMRPSRETVRLLPLILPVSVLGTAIVVVAGSHFAASSPPTKTVLGAWAFLAVTALAEAFPVPLERVPVGGTSVAMIFVVGASVVYGWEAATLTAFLAMVFVECARRRPLTRIAYNGGAYALAGAATAAGGIVDSGDSFVLLVPEVALAATAFYVTDLTLVALAVSRSAREPFMSLLRGAVSSTLIAFSIMTSLALLLAVLWDRSPLLSAALVGPVVAIALYQRSVHRELKAMRLALTDPLTGLGNHRYFYEQLENALTKADSTGAHVALCIFESTTSRKSMTLTGTLPETSCWSPSPLGFDKAVRPSASAVTSLPSCSSGGRSTKPSSSRRGCSTGSPR
jgi:hypothetical protein